MNSLVLALLMVTLLLIAFIGDMLQFAVRIGASIYEHPNLATHMVSLSMLLLRAGMSSGLLLIGFSIDTGISVQQLVFTYCVLAALLGLVYLFVARFSSFSLGLLKPFIIRYYRLDVQDHAMPHLAVPWRRPKVDNILVFFLALSGFLLPSIFAATYPQYRATLLQTGFIINSVSTIYFALKVEKDLALTLNGGSTENKWAACIDFMYARTLGCLLTLLVLPLFLLLPEVHP